MEEEMDYDSTILIPPLNFAMVCPGVYRSGYPVPMNFCFLKQKSLKTILCLCPEILKKSSIKFAEQNDIAIHSLKMSESKEPFIGISNEIVVEALQILLDPTNHPVLVHCDRGKFRTGVVTACLRKVQGWALTATLAEYCRFAGIWAKDNPRLLDFQFIELFQFPSHPWSHPHAPSSTMLPMPIKSMMNSKSADSVRVSQMIHAKEIQSVLHDSKCPLYSHDKADLESLPSNAETGLDTNEAQCNPAYQSKSSAHQNCNDQQYNTSTCQEICQTHEQQRHGCGKIDNKQDFEQKNIFCQNSFLSLEANDV
mmetsp:Transcript_22552/g.29518  ORF Transcript_22552/g.29518 Transcript_22552/m.29518 type:complete len:310 (-) Transcript_22552:7-936(-)